MIFIRRSVLCLLAPVLICAMGVGSVSTSRAQHDNEPGGDRRGGAVLGESDEEMSAAQAIADMERARRRRVSSSSAWRIEDLQTYEYDLVGADEDALLKEATVRALKSTAARLYFHDYVILGRDVLEPYLGVYGDRFVTQRLVTSRRQQADGSYRLSVRVGVDVGRLYQDLDEKHFLAKPKLRPITAVLLDETIDGQPLAESRGRQLLEASLRRSDVRVESERMAAYGLGTNAAAAPEALAAARDEAQRWNVDVIVTGSLTLTSRTDRIILFDQVFFIDSVLTLDLVRVDNGEILRTLSDKYSTWGVTAAEAETNLLENVLPRSADRLVDGFIEDWTKTMLDQTDYRIMFTGVGPELLTSITNMLKTLSPSVEVYVKSFYGDVAVLNVVYPDALPGQIEQFLRKSKVPQFHVRPENERRLEVEVL